MSVYDNEINNNPQLNPYRYAQLHPSPEVARLLASDKAAADALRTAEGNRILARLREQDRASTGKSTFVNDEIAHEKFDGEPVQELEIDEPVNWKRES